MVRCSEPFTKTSSGKGPGVADTVVEAVETDIAASLEIGREG